MYVRGPAAGNSAAPPRRGAAIAIEDARGRIYFGKAENVGGKLRALIVANSPRVVLLDCSAIPGFEYAPSFSRQLPPSKKAR